MRTVWRCKFLILALVVAAPAVAYLVERGKPKLFSSTATVSVSQVAVNSPLLSRTQSIPTTNLHAIAAIVTTTSVARVAGDLLTPRETPEELDSGVSASANPQTDFIAITAIRNSPTLAAAVANAFARALGAHQVAAARKDIDAAIAADSTQPSLKGQVPELIAALHNQSGDVSIIQRATPDATPIGPHPKRAIELGLAVGILLAVVSVTLLHSFDRRLRTPDDLEDLTRLPILATFAPSAFRAELETTPVDEEAFQTLRTSLTYFTVDRPIKSVLVASPGEKEGKSTVAVRLALSSARSGLNVILVDADLRRGGATAKLRLEPLVGLGTVLAERRPAETALIEWPLDEGEPGRLRILAAGAAPPNPAALISSTQMHGLIATLEDRSDILIIDTPAGLAVSDAVPLMQHVSGVVLVARMNRSSRDTVRRLHKIIDAAHGHLLGVVATGVTKGPGYEKYSQAYYAPTAGGRRGRRHGARNRVTAGTVEFQPVPPEAGYPPIEEIYQQEADTIPTDAPDAYPEPAVSFTENWPAMPEQRWRRRRELRRRRKELRRML